MFRRVDLKFSPDALDVLARAEQEDTPAHHTVRGTPSRWAGEPPEWRSRPSPAVRRLSRRRPPQVLRIASRLIDPANEHGAQWGAVLHCVDRMPD